MEKTQEPEENVSILSPTQAEPLCGYNLLHGVGQ